MAGGIWPTTVGILKTRRLIEHMEEIECGDIMMDVADGKYAGTGKSRINYTYKKGINNKSQ